jgi:sodium/potassium-transporting ATPase subunit alpha
MQVENLVPGDVVEISEGDVIPADMRVIESHDMKVDKKLLVGREDVEEVAVVAHGSSKSLLEQKNVLFFGFVCKEGSGKGVVVVTGQQTAIGEVNNKNYI